MWLSGKESTSNTGNAGWIPGSGPSTGGGNGNPLQYSCWKYPMGRGVWWATVHRVTKSQTRLSNWARTQSCLTGDFWIMTLTCASLIHKTYSSLLNLLNVSEQIKLKQSIYDITPYKKMLSNWSWKDYSSSSSSTHGLLKLSLHLMTIIQNTWAGTWVTAINLSSSESKLLNFLFMSSSCEEMENLNRLWMWERKLLKGRARMLPETEKWAKMGVQGRKQNSLISSQHPVNMGSTKSIHPKRSRWVRENHRPQWSNTFRTSVPDPEKWQSGSQIPGLAPCCSTHLSNKCPLPLPTMKHVTRATLTKQPCTLENSASKHCTSCKKDGKHTVPQS